MKEVEAMEEMMSIVANFGFPMALSVYLLTRLEGKIDNLSGAIGKLSNSVDQISQWEHKSSN